ncbi:RagB/SusD family nutrient uptake outer membrane protein [Hymenobacter sp. H14-R3]|uniref:RagB/SusD family nutrient uptake outer membrane protein n=1 Tax=Hymenobacter sp. H14-R3 TaxID=3046308 RepID=UPI0024B97871|nr:RagB/SusD family nutrient uptake outer membrane protein [Hymenobacter sp. H14-R3]MDJ0367489.1 RagB/SusD family nutrient uptake outer membrane protein [Hymenobacter sp. H14-R3]
MEYTFPTRYALAALLLGPALATLSGCNKNFLDENPKSILTPDNLYVDRAGFETGLYGLYNLVRNERSGTDGAANFLTFGAAFDGTDNGYSIFPAVSSNDQVFQDFGAVNTPLFAGVNQTWRYLYQLINAANTIIGRADDPKVSLSDADKGQIVGEARLIRAMAYRHLAYLFGDVPLNLVESTGSTIRTDWDRNPVAEVRKQMEDDFLFAEANMADTPPTENRMPRAMATHFLAELYLTTGDNQKAKDKALSVVRNPRYKLITARYGVNSKLPGTPFTDMFLDGNSLRSQGNTEELWVLQNEYLSLGGDFNIMRRWWVNRYDNITVGGKRPIAISAEYGGRGLGRLGITRFGLDLYAPGDDRGSVYAIRKYYLYNNPASLPSKAKLGDTLKTTATGFEAVNSTNWPSTRKWDYAPPVATDVQNSSTYNDQIYLRVADTYLLLAEAQFQLGDAAGAAVTINALRTRAHAKPITAANVTLDYILDERSRELVTEEYRRYTLLRTNKWLERTKLYNKLSGPKITDRDKLLPIPQSVIDANLTKVMTQNPGY